MFLFRWWDSLQLGPPSISSPFPNFRFKLLCFVVTLEAILSKVPDETGCRLISRGLFSIAMPLVYCLEKIGKPSGCIGLLAILIKRQLVVVQT